MSARAPVSAPLAHPPAPALQQISGSEMHVFAQYGLRSTPAPHTVITACMSVKQRPQDAQGAALCQPQRPSQTSVQHCLTPSQPRSG